MNQFKTQIMKTLTKNDCFLQYLNIKPKFGKYGFEVYGELNSKPQWIIVGYGKTYRAAIFKVI